ncbi:MAG TPA: 4Fe-4S dicluster domain-containing protein [Bryobacteraceae bacterium]|nr:4Fe-4S dicluster domain-containing protein [Bryobacteraceae bacterium]
MQRRGYQVIGPTIKDSAITYGPIEGIEDLPIGWTAEQEPGSYRLRRRSDAALFAFANGPKSLKNFLHPAEIKLFGAEKSSGAFHILPNGDPTPRYAFLGVRACELAAMGIQDRVLMEDRYRDPVYAARRRNCMVIAVQCTEPAATCFCTSMGTGPRAKYFFDLALTELVDAGAHEFVVEVGTDLGAELLSEVQSAEASEEILRRSREATGQAEQGITRRLETDGLPELLQNSFDHPQWDDVASRCLACGNCTMVCPTCFCVTVEDTSDVTGDHADRWRKWDSCFTLGFSYIHGGSLRTSTKSRYRQWLTHKLSYWHDQFGSSGCVGCGRCMAWCPVGIDLTKEVPAFAQERGAQ